DPPLVIHGIGHAELDLSQVCSQRACTGNSGWSDIEGDDLVGDTGEEAGEVSGATTDLERACIAAPSEDREELRTPGPLILRIFKVPEITPLPQLVAELPRLLADEGSLGHRTPPACTFVTLRIFGRPGGPTATRPA